jgi:hypothetical protein
MRGVNFLTVNGNPSKPKLVQIIKNSVRTSKTTPHVTITKINWLMLLKEIIAVYPENRTKPLNTNYRLMTVNTAGTYGYHSALKG